MNRWSLNNINQKLETNKLNIINERQQIIRAEHLLSHFEKSFAEQNKITNYIRDNSHTLVKEIYNDGSKKFKTNSDSVASIYHQGSNPPPNQKESVMDRISSIPHSINKTLTIENQSNKRLVCERRDERIVINRKNTDSTENIITIVIPDSPEAQLDPLLKEIHIPELPKDTLIHRIIYTNYLVACGSNGMLLTYSKRSPTRIYTTRIDSAIIHVEMVTKNQIQYYVAFTSERVLFFDVDKDNLYRSIVLPKTFLRHIENIQKVKNTIYITNYRRQLKMIAEDSWKIEKVTLPDYPNLRYYFPICFQSQVRLVMLEDSNLYKIRNNISSKLKLVPGITDVKEILKCRPSMFLCYSENNAWLIDNEAVIIDSMTFKYGVKFIDADSSNMVIVDRNNTIHVYYLSNNDNHASKILEHSIEGVITTISVVNNIVYLAMNGVIYSINLTLLP